VLLSAEAAWACGGGGVTSASGVVTDSQRIVISKRAGGLTDVVVQVTVPSTTADYGVLIPVPSQPMLDAQPVSAAELRELDELTAPHIETETSSGGGGCGCIAAGAADTKGSSNGVSVSAPVNIGPVVAVSLTGEDAGAIGAWLSEHGFSLPEADASILADYVGAGNYFIALRRSESASLAGPSSIGIHYSLQGDHRKLSLAFSRIGAAATVAFTLFIAAPQAIAPSSPFVGLTLNDLDARLLRAGDYAAAVAEAVAKNGSKAFVLEGVTSRERVAPSLPNLASLFDAGSVITRATAVIRKENLDEDAVFVTPFAGSIPNTRSASFRVPRGRFASLGALGVLALCGWRRGRRWRDALPSLERES
jgi:hypothetical protein